ncbi:MAG TPA: hypothetical protein VL354_14185, partial [Spirochaetia bacterium]|nr:hypothetical protein [Spirochaetia bacterium]
MAHLLFLHFVLIYTVGFASLLFMVSLYVRSRARPVLAFVVYYLAFTLKVVLSGAVVYVAANLTDEGIRTAVGRIDIWVTLFLASTIVHLMERFTPSRRLPFVEWGFDAAALVLLVLGAFPSAVLQSSSPAYILLALASIYALVKSAVLLRSADAASRGFSVIMVAGLAVFIPLMFLPIFFETPFRSLTGHAPLQLITFPIFYAANGVLFSAYLHHHYGRPAGEGQLAVTLERGAYGLSEREVEVIWLVAAGHSNK